VVTEVTKNSRKRNLFANHSYRFREFSFTDKTDISWDVDTGRTCMFARYKVLFRRGPPEVSVPQCPGWTDLHTGSTEPAVRFLKRGGNRAHDVVPSIVDDAKGLYTSHISTRPHATATTYTEVVILHKQGGLYNWEVSENVPGYVFLDSDVFCDFLQFAVAKLIAAPLINWHVERTRLPAAPLLLCTD
jgi:hypothetical protein